MSKLSADDVVAPDDLAMLMGLAVSCPAGQDKPVDCPLHEIRDLPLVQRFAWMKLRTREEANNILSYHRTICPTMRQLKRSSFR